MPAPTQSATAPRASSILIQPTPGAVLSKPPAAGAPASISTKAWAAFRQVFFTVGDVTDAGKLYTVLDRLQKNLVAIFGVVTTNAIIPGNIIRGVVFTAGQTQYLAHGLGRPWQGYFCVRAQTNPAVFTDVAYATGTTADSILPLLSGNAGTYDIYVF